MLWFFDVDVRAYIFQHIFAVFTRQRIAKLNTGSFFEFGHVKACFLTLCRGRAFEVSLAECSMRHSILIGSSCHVLNFPVPLQWQSLIRSTVFQFTGSHYSKCSSSRDPSSAIFVSLRYLYLQTLSISAPLPPPQPRSSPPRPPTRPRSRSGRPRTRRWTSTSVPPVSER